MEVTLLTPSAPASSIPHFFKHFQSVLRPLKALWKCVCIPRGVFGWMLWELFRGDSASPCCGSPTLVKLSKANSFLRELEK